MLYFGLSPTAKNNFRWEARSCLVSTRDKDKYIFKLNSTLFLSQICPKALERLELSFLQSPQELRRLQWADEQTTRPASIKFYQTGLIRHECNEMTVTLSDRCCEIPERLNSNWSWFDFQWTQCTIITARGSVTNRVLHSGLPDMLCKTSSIGNQN